MSKSIDGMGASSKTLSGLGQDGTSSTTAISLAGGAAGQVPYQTAPGVTTFTNATNGVLENLSNIDAFTSTLTSVKRLTAPAADDLEFIVGGAAKKIKLQTANGAGSDITLNTNGGGANAWTVGGSTGLLSSSTSNISLTGSNTISVGSSSVVIGPASVAVTSGGASSTIINGTVTTSLGSFSTASTPGTLTLNGTGAGFGTLVIDLISMVQNTLDYAIRTTFAARALTLSTNLGLLKLSANGGATAALQITTANTVALPAITSAPFLTTNASNVITAGTVLGVANGGTGVSSVTMPKVTNYTSSGNIVLTGVPKIIEIMLTGAGGGGGGSTTQARSGGGGGGTTSIMHVPYNAAAGYYSCVIGTGGAGGVAPANGTTGGLSTFSINGVVTMSNTGGIGGTGGSTNANFPGGPYGGYSYGEKVFRGGYGGPGAAQEVGGYGGSSYRNGSLTTPTVTGNYNGFGGGSGGDGGTGCHNGDGGDGADGLLTVTEYYY